MASSFPSFESFGSPVNPANSVTHLYRSVKRTVSGSRSGNFSESWIPISSVSSQSKVFGTRFASSLVIRFFRVILVPVRNFHHEILRSIGNALAAQPRLHGQTRRVVELVKLRIRCFVAAFEALVDNHVARGAGTHAAACVIESHFIAER